MASLELLFHVLRPAQQNEQFPSFAYLPLSPVLKTQIFQQGEMFKAAADTTLCKLGINSLFLPLIRKLMLSLSLFPSDWQKFSRRTDAIRP